MKIFGCHKRIFALTLMLAFSVSSAIGLDAGTFCGFRYGPNLSWSIMGNAPFVWGEWLPQLEGGFHYTWLEPIEPINYGEKMGKNPTYLKMDASVELSPFYAGYQAGLGLRPFKTNPQVEVVATYWSFFYIKSNLEMVTADVAGGGKIADTWNADYIVDNVWGGDDEFDYGQFFDVSVIIEYYLPKAAMLGLNMHYILTDISTDFTGKSYDYRVNMPVFSRDFILDFELYGMYMFNKNVAAVFETAYYRTGMLSNGSTVEKEALKYLMVKAGPHFSWKDGLQNITLELGFWKRLKDRFYNGNIAQEFIIQLKYEGYFSFPIHNNVR